MRIFTVAVNVISIRIFDMKKATLKILMNISYEICGKEFWTSEDNRERYKFLEAYIWILHYNYNSENVQIHMFPRDDSILQ